MARPPESQKELFQACASGLGPEHFRLPPPSKQEVLGGAPQAPSSAAAPPPPPALQTPLLSSPGLAPGASRRNMECQTRILFPLHLFTFPGLLHVLNGIIQKLTQTGITWADNSSIKNVSYLKQKANIVSTWLLGSQLSSPLPSVCWESPGPKAKYFRAALCPAWG